MNRPTDLLKTLQVQFLKAAARWTNYGIEVEPASVSLPNIVCLLKSVGYAIRQIDSVCPEDVTPLRDNQKGTRIVVTCSHSGQKCILELPEEADQCNCIIKNNEKDSYWEVTASNSSLIETGSGAVPPVSKELNTLLKHTLNCLLHMIQGTLKDVEPEEAGLLMSASGSNTSSPKKGAKRISGFMQDLVNVPIIISSPKGSPTRCKSLDTLTVSADERTVRSGLLTPKIGRTKETIITKSSPNINLFGKNEVASSNGSTIENSSSETVVQLLRKAISLLEINKTQEVSTSKTPHTDKKVKLTESTFSKDTTPDLASKELNTMRPKSASSPSLAMKKRVKSTSTSKIPTTPADDGRPARPGSAKLPVKTNRLGVKTKSPKVTEETKIICSKPKKVTNLYAHIKSTIPKASPTGNYVSKKT